VGGSPLYSSDSDLAKAVMKTGHLQECPFRTAFAGDALGRGLAPKTNRVKPFGEGR
jgi:hypothetical protein